MQLTCYGAAREVTGSKHLLEVGGKRVLLDCGMFQGRRQETARKNREFGFNAAKLDAVVLSHAHIDHSGLIPLLTKNGYNGRIYCTPATRDLCAVMLLDSANIQQRDAEYLSRKHREFVPPLYDEHDARRVMRHFVSVPYAEPFDVCEGVTATFRDAGHILGSAMVQLTLKEAGNRQSFLFSGDIGRKRLPILNDPWQPEPADTVLMESTYGDRDHEPFEAMEAHLREAVVRTVDRGGKIIIPSFALERAQEVVHSIKLLEQDPAFPTVPVFVDSPLTVHITDVFRMHTEAYDDDTSDLYKAAGDPFSLRNIQYISEVEDSMKLNDRRDPCIIIAASGMCEFGRILHHLKNHCTDPRNTIMIVGWQAEHTLGRRIVEKRPMLKIFGQEYPLKAEVKIFNGFSGHAGRTPLIEFGVNAGTHAKRVALVHGEQPEMDSLREGLEARGVKNILMPERGKPIIL